jgi:hypothetical protein
MQRKLGILAVLFVLGLMVPVVATGLEKPITDAEIVARISRGLEVDRIGTSPVSVARNPVRRFSSKSCTPYGYLCDPRYTTGVVCCPGTHCFSPYPGVPQYCL